MNSSPQSTPEIDTEPRFQTLRTGLLIVGSALLGGLAVVLWNRSSLARLRQSAEPLTPPAALPDEEEG